MMTGDETSQLAQRSGRALVELRGVDVAFGRNNVLRGIDLSIPAGRPWP